jgi:hypothetical protein
MRLETTPTLLGKTQTLQLSLYTKLVLTFCGLCRNQIEKNSSLTQQERLDYLEEGKKVRQKLEDDRLKVESIKQKKL